jgi:putative DNA primase/helicase
MGKVVSIRKLADEDVEALAAEAAEQYDPADVGNAQRFAKQHGEILKHCPSLACWLIWNGKCWAADSGDQVMAFAIKTVKSLFDEVGKQRGLKEQEAAFKFYAASSKRERLRAMIDIARHMLATDISEFDRDKFALNCNNGTVDLRTGKIKAHDPADLITKMIAIDYDPRARAPRWAKFLSEVMTVDVASYVQRAVGYSVTGDQRAECMFITYGGGANGKGVFFDKIRDAVGQYGSTGRSELLIHKRYENQNNEDVAMLRGQRFVEVSETGETHELNEEQVKNLTGQDRIKASMKYKSLVEFDPTHHIWLRTNAKPNVRGTNFAIWRRLKLIPFAVRFMYPREIAALIQSGAVRKGDPLVRVRNDNLRDQLRGETAGILTWVIKGATLWWNNGRPDLREPKVVTEAIDEYRSEQDRLGQFLDDRCLRDASATTFTGELYVDYCKWAKEKGLKAWADITLGMRLGDAGFKAVQVDGRRARAGLKLKPTAEQIQTRKLEKMK